MSYIEVTAERAPVRVRYEDMDPETKAWKKSGAVQVDSIPYIDGFGDENRTLRIALAYGARRIGLHAKDTAVLVKVAEKTLRKIDTVMQDPASKKKIEPKYALLQPHASYDVYVESGHRVILEEMPA